MSEHNPGASVAEEAERYSDTYATVRAGRHLIPKFILDRIVLRKAKMQRGPAEKSPEVRNSRRGVDLGLYLDVINAEVEVAEAWAFDDDHDASPTPVLSPSQHKNRLRYVPVAVIGASMLAAVGLLVTAAVSEHGGATSGAEPVVTAPPIPNQVSTLLRPAQIHGPYGRHYENDWQLAKIADYDALDGKPAGADKALTQIRNVSIQDAAEYAIGFSFAAQATEYAYDGETGLAITRLSDILPPAVLATGIVDVDDGITATALGSVFNANLSEARTLESSLGISADKSVIDAAIRQRGDVTRYGTTPTALETEVSDYSDLMSGETSTLRRFAADWENVINTGLIRSI